MKGHVLVTGCSVGLGRATALQLAREGWCVFAGVRSDADAESLRREAPANLEPVPLDVADPAAVAATSERIADAVGEAGLHGLVNNAGLVVNTPIEFMTDDDFDFQFGVNLRGPIRLVQALLPQLRAARGRIVNVTSGVTKVSQPFTSLYAASKASLDQLSQVLRLELEPWSIAVILVDPGLMRTRMTESGEDAAARSMAAWPEEARKLYGEANVRNVKRITASLPRAKDPEVVARAITRALAEPAPRDRYLVGSDAKAADLLSRLLPWRLKQKLVTKLVFGD